MTDTASRIAECRAIIKSDADPFRMVWRKASDAERRMLLTIAKRPAWLAPLFWDELSADTRAAIKRRAADLREWLNKALTPEAVQS